jgi:hypothetical protein
VNQDIQPFIQRAREADVMQGNGIWQPRETRDMLSGIRGALGKGAVRVMQGEINHSIDLREQDHDLEIAERGIMDASDLINLAMTEAGGNPAVLQELTPLMRGYVRNVQRRQRYTDDSSCKEQRYERSYTGRRHPSPVGARNSATLRDLDVFVDGSAESVTSDDRDVGGFGLGECS